MRRSDFLEEHASSWSRLESLLLMMESGRRGRRALTGLSTAGPDATEFDALYRLVCRHLALARQRDYGSDVADRLNDLAIRSYRQLYGERRGFGATLLRLVVTRIPGSIRERGRVVLLAAAVFYLPLIAMGLIVADDPFFARTVLSAQQIRSFESMYDPTAEHLARERDSEGDLAMFGYYIMNNVGLAFQTFAWGIAGGVGTLFVLIHNGLAIGATAGHMASAGLGATFFPFIAGHAAFELTGIVLAGAAGIDMGWAVIAPGRLLRTEALRRAARRGADLLGGAFLLLVLAAFVEAFWSSKNAIPAGWKYGVAALLWLLVGLWIANRGRHGP